jgi:hypothetical protein
MKTYVDVPDTLVNIIGTRPVSKLISFTTNVLVPLGHLETPDRARKKTGTHEVQEAGRENEEELKFGARATPESS